MTINAQAMNLLHADAVELSPGELLTHVVELEKSPEQRVEVKLTNAPAGARLRVNQSGQLYVSWQAGPDLPGKSSFSLLAIDVDTRQVLDRSEVFLLRKLEPEVVQPPQQVQQEPIAPGDPVDQLPATEPTAPGFEPFEHQLLQVGVPWFLQLRLDDENGDAVQIRAEDLPVGARITAVPDGSYDLDWTPVKGQQGGHTLTLRAFHDGDSVEFSEQQITLTVNPEPLTEQETTQRSGSLKAPQLNPLPNQIISAGRVVSFNVKPTLSDGSPAILQVDRLPNNASFDENEDGSRTFYWQTSDRDQGEHLFRFTAIHPEDGNLRAWKEVLIIVGDPSRGSTSPVDNSQGS